MAGYSGKPLWQKLGLKPGMRAVAINPPAAYRDLLGDGAPELSWGSDLVAETEVLHVFADKCAPLETALTNARHLIAQDGMIWVSWPKKASKLPSEITEDTVRAIALPMGLVDVKVCAVSDIWSGLKLVIRKELRT
ncbi:DUF3052 family protein [Shimia sp.]|uniref:DUF3052 family protein n=1 Tax=Shimia sp. TaxID=1954381 RepID=UPI003299F05E